MALQAAGRGGRRFEAVDQKLTIDLIKARLNSTTDEEERKEVEKELEIAENILCEIGEVITEKEAKNRVWNLKDYDSYRS